MELNQIPSNITHYSLTTITLHNIEHPLSLWMTPQIIRPWPPKNVSTLRREDFEPLINLQPALTYIILGTGKVPIFPDPEVLSDCHNRQISVEIMSNDAACRTFNILASEDRRFACALLLS